jgi:hypothetical protein
MTDPYVVCRRKCLGIIEAAGHYIDSIRLLIDWFGK